MTKSGRVTAAIAAIAACAVAFVFFLWPKAAEKKYEGPVEKIVVGVPKIVSTALFDVAAARGLFKAQGLDVEAIGYSSGLKAMDDLMQDKLDIAIATEFVVAAKHFLHPDVRILASIARPDLHEMIARKDRGITEPAHLKGKRIGVTRESSGDFFLETFLAHQGIPAGEVTILDIAPPKLPDALSAGTVEAVMTWEPMVGKIKERLGADAVSWPGQSRQAYYLLLMTRDDFVSKRPGTSERLLRALIEAEDYAATHVREAQDIVAKRLEHDSPAIQALWPRCDFRVRLDQDLLLLMEEEARWVLRHKRLKKEMPNYLDVVHRDALRRIKPEAVSIID